ncbi:hypothetical protein [Xanthobacter agilis]|uniref:hypothetical protein n=1 Tax=Xanthobacter agilis TaxID=47492 RepID=UPI0037282048
MSVITHDFGADKRRTTRRFRKLLSLDALHEANVEANPLPYLERASERIFQLEKVVFEAVLASRPAPGETPSGETVTIDADECRRLRAALAILESAHPLVNGTEDKDT